MKILHKFYIACLLLLVPHASALYAQNIVINEVMPVNSTVLADEDGSYEDWIELHNKGSVAVNLQGYGLSDDLREPFKWTFPSVTIEAGGYLLVWASGKNIRPDNGMLNGVMREVFTGIAGNTIADLTKHSSWPDSPTQKVLHEADFEAPVNLSDNYGIRMHGYIQAPESGMYTFWIASDGSGSLLLSSDENPNNATEIASLANSVAYRQWEMYGTQKSAQVQLEAGRLYYISALMKEGSGTDHLTVRWQLPSGGIEEPIPYSQLYWKGSGLHTNFSVSSEGEDIILTGADGTRLDEVAARAVASDVSYGRASDGTWVLFDQSTPLKANSNQGAAGILAAPVFSTPGGIYGNEFHVRILHPEPGVKIYYTLDGSVPKPDNLQGNKFPFKQVYRLEQSDTDGGLIDRGYITYSYSEPIAITNNTGVKDSQSQITAVIDNKPLTPLASPHAGTIIRAIAVKDGFLPSEVISSTYLIRPQPYPIPVVSLVLPEESLFSYYTGIHVPGVTFDKWREQNWNTKIRGTSPANYHNRGMEWEKEVNIEFFDTQGLPVFNHRAGLRIHGGWTRSYHQKSLRLIARSQYGTPEFRHQFFPDKDTDVFKSFLLRGSGNDYLYTFFRDAFMQRLVKNRAIDIQHWQPAITYINGEYWGILNIRDRNDENYIGYKYNINPDRIDLLEGDAIVKQGTNYHYMSLLNYARQNDLAEQAHFDHINTMVDTENFAEYYATQIYVNNGDWPHNNIDFWRYQANGYKPDAPYGQDGRWRWMLFDMDQGFWPWDDKGQPWENTFQRVTRNDWSTELFRLLLKNRQFSHTMINRVADLLNMNFRTDTVIKLVDEMQKVYEPVINDHIDRWHQIYSRNTWNKSVERLREYARQRPAYLRQHVTEHFSLTGTWDLTLNVGSGRGSIRINTIEVDNPRHWDGIYFNDVPIELEAIARINYKFSHWSGDISSDSPLITVTSSQAKFLEAHFIPSTDPVLVFFWVFDDAMQNNTPMTTIDDTYHAITPGQLSFHSALQGYPFSSGHNSWRKASMERRNNPTDLNYREAGNNRIPYSQVDMKGLQIKQPFIGDAGENMMVFNMPTTGYGDVVFSFAAIDEDAADYIRVEYSVDANSTWINTGIVNTQLQLSNTYSLYKIDFKDIDAADNNAHFKIRLRFEGGKMNEDQGNRVTFNNVSLDGVPLHNVNMAPEMVKAIALQPVIEGQPEVLVDISRVFTDPDADDIAYAAQSAQQEFVSVSMEGESLKLDPRQRGDAMVTVTASDGVNEEVEHSFRVLVYPKAHDLEKGDFVFDQWDSNHGEKVYPQSMIFLQSDVADPGINAELTFPYFIPHSDYPAADQSTVGFPYNNHELTRINGLGADGISFVNTGRARDLGAALVAVKTKGLDRVSLLWTGGTVEKNKRLNGIRLQYRVGVSGPFRDVVFNENTLEYIASENGHVQRFPAVSVPREALNQDYVQFLWRYYSLGTGPGERAQLRLDDIKIGDFAADPFAFNNDGNPWVVILYPNPATDYINVKSDSLVTSVDMFTVTGSLLYRYVGEDKNIKVPIDFLNSGVYLLRVNTTSQAYIRKFLVYR